MIGLSFDFYLVTLLLCSIFLVHILNILYLIIYKANQRIKSIKYLLMNASFSSLIVSIWLIPFFYFRLIWSTESTIWRIWSYMFHVCDAVQIYSLFFMITLQSCQRLSIVFIWLAPLIAYSPVLWLPSFNVQVDYLPYRRFSTHVPWWILLVLYLSMYIIPILIELLLSSLLVCCPSIFDKKHKDRRRFFNRSANEHQKEMAELTSLIHTVLNFQLDPTDTETDSVEVENID